MFSYEIIPAYIFILLNGVNIVCLTTQNASKRTVDVITNLCGGKNSNEGLGFLSLSFVIRLAIHWVRLHVAVYVIRDSWFSLLT